MTNLDLTNENLNETQKPPNDKAASLKPDDTAWFFVCYSFISAVLHYFKSENINIVKYNLPLFFVQFCNSTFMQILITLMSFNDNQVQLPNLFLTKPHHPMEMWLITRNLQLCTSETFIFNGQWTRMFSSWSSFPYFKNSVTYQNDCMIFFFKREFKDFQTRIPMSQALEAFGSKSFGQFLGLFLWIL